MAEQATEETVAQAPVSVEDKILAHFMPPEAEQEETEAAEPEPTEEASEGDDPVEGEVSGEPELFEIELSGEQYKVPASVRDAIMREADYTKKTSELATTRRAIDLQAKELALINQRRQFDASVSDDVKNLELIDSYIKSQEQQDWSRASPDKRTEVLLELQSLRSRRDELGKSLGSKWQEFQAKTGEETAKLRKEAAEALSKSIPKFDETKTEIEKYVVGLGYTEVQAQNMSVQDYLVANKARLYDQLQAEKSSAVQKASQKKGKVITPTSRKTMPDETKQYLNYRKTMNNPKASLQEKQAALKDRIARKFGA
jgi:hypothetical protein